MLHLKDQSTNTKLKKCFYQIRVTNDYKTTDDHFSGNHGDTATAETAVLPHYADQEAASTEIDVQVKLVTKTSMYSFLSSHSVLF